MKMKAILVVFQLVLMCSVFGHIAHLPIEESQLEETWTQADLVLWGRVDKLQAVYDEGVLRGYSVRLVVERAFKGGNREEVEFRKRLFVTRPPARELYRMFGNYVVFLRKGNDGNSFAGYHELLSVGMRLEGDQPFDSFIEAGSIEDQTRRFILSKILKMNEPTE